MTGAEYCENLVRGADKDRYLAALFAPSDRRSSLYVIYAFDIETAAVSQRVRDPVAGEVRLQWWEDALTQEGNGAGNPVVEALLETTAEWGVDGTLPLAVIGARRRDLYTDKNQTEAEFELLSAETAGSIFQMATEVLAGTASEPTRLACHHAGVAALARTPALAKLHRDAVKALLPQLPEAALPALLPLALLVDGRASLAQWRKQWILWRASKNLAAWL
ncbi:MAG: squalene/phytoene synthase family protein [Pseudorhodoplanes sp.]